MIQNNRIFFSDNGVLSDISVEMNDFVSGVATLPVVAAQDFIYLASDLPFNHRFFEVSTVNALASVLSVQYLGSSGWIDAVDVIDQTSSSGKTLAQSGVVSWQLARNEGWLRKNTSDISELSTLNIDGMYWARLKFSADLTLSTALAYVGMKFSSDADLNVEYPQLLTSGALDQWPSQPKTNYKEQEYRAAEEVVAELKRKGQVYTESQILNWELFKPASVHKTAELIFNAYGKDYFDLRDEAKKKFYSSMNIYLYQVDKNGDGRLQIDEKITDCSVVRR